MNLGLSIPRTSLLLSLVLVLAGCTATDRTGSDPNDEPTFPEAQLLEPSEAPDELRAFDPQNTTDGILLELFAVDGNPGEVDLRLFGDGIHPSEDGPPFPAERMFAAYYHVDAAPGWYVVSYAIAFEAPSTARTWTSYLVCTGSTDEPALGLVDGEHAAALTLTDLGQEAEPAPNPGVLEASLDALDLQGEDPCLPQGQDQPGPPGTPNKTSESPP